MAETPSRYIKHPDLGGGPTTWYGSLIGRNDAHPLNFLGHCDVCGAFESLRTTIFLSYYLTLH